eukprot:1217777-Prymnesium_polylepis.1
MVMRSATAVVRCAGAVEYAAALPGSAARRRERRERRRGHGAWAMAARADSAFVAFTIRRKPRKSGLLQ